MQRLSLMTALLLVCACQTDFNQADYCASNPDHPDCPQLFVSQDTDTSADGVVTVDDSVFTDDAMHIDTSPDIIVTDTDVDPTGEEEVSDTEDSSDTDQEIDEPDVPDVDDTTDAPDVTDTSDTADTDSGDGDVEDIESDGDLSTDDTSDADTDSTDDSDVVEPECVIDSDCEYLNENLCNGSWKCVEGECAFSEKIVDCSKTETLPCYISVCEPSDGTCQAQKTEDGVSCNDSDPCTENDVCTSGSCAGDPITCPCLDDADCIELEDDDLCNGTLACVDGDCTLDPTSVVVCKDSLTCETETCIPASGECSSTPVICNDDVGCTIDVCVEDVGCTFTADHPSCDDGDDCTVNTCNTNSGCSAIPSFSPCDDEDPCTKDDTCTKDLACVGVDIDCDDLNPCTNDSCQNGDCLFTPHTNECDDGDPCTINDVCQSSVCEGELVCECEGNADCADKNDLNLCNGSYMCDKSTAVWTCEIDPSSIVNCPDPIGQCLVTSCVPSTGACVESFAPSSTPCDDGDACTDSDVCAINGSCGGSNKTCNDDNPCTDDSCDSSLGCVYKISAPKPCDDGNEDTVTDECSGGLCSGVVLFKEFFNEGAPADWDFDQNADGSIIFDVTNDEWNDDPSNFYLGVWIISEITLTETLMLSVTLPELPIPNSESPKLSFVRWGGMACGVGNLHWHVDDELVDGSCGSESDIGTFVPLDPSHDFATVVFTFTIQPGTHSPGLKYRIDNVKMNK